MAMKSLEAQIQQSTSAKALKQATKLTSWSQVSWTLVCDRCDHHPCHQGWNHPNPGRCHGHCQLCHCLLGQGPFGQVLRHTQRGPRTNNGGRQEVVWYRSKLSRFSMLASPRSHLHQKTTREENLPSPELLRCWSKGHGMISFIPALVTGRLQCCSLHLQLSHRRHRPLRAERLRQCRFILRSRSTPRRKPRRSRTRSSSHRRRRRRKRRKRRKRSNSSPKKSSPSSSSSTSRTEEKKIQSAIKYGTQFHAAAEGGNQKLQEEEKRKRNRRDPLCSSTNIQWGMKSAHR